MRNDTKVVLEQIEAKALKRGERHRFTQSEDVMAVERVVSMDEIMTFFKASELVNMEEGQLIFGEEDSEQYFYGVVSGEIHLFCEGFGNSGLELLKVAGSDECIVSLSAFLHYFAVGPQTFGELKLHAKCGQSGNYYRVPILELIRYVREDKRKMNEICKTILIRQQKFVLGLNDLTGIAPRLHTQSYLDPNYTPIDVEPGVLELDSPLAHQAFEGLQTLFQLPLEDRRLCWVGVLDSRTMLLRRFKQAKYVFYLHDGMVACTVSKLRRSYNAVQFYLKGGEMIGWREAVVGLDMDIQFQVADGAKAIVVAIPDFVVRSHFEQNPEICVPLIAKLFNRYGLPARQICYALRYTHKRANEVIYKLRFLLDAEETKSGPSVRYGIIEKGDWFGMVAMYTDSPQVHRTVVCDRYCDLGIMPRYVISVITSAFREAAGYQVDYMARCIHRDYENTPLDTDKMHDSRFQVDSFGLHTWRSYRMVCVYPSSSEIPAKIYCDELARHHTCKANVVTKQDAMNSLRLSEFTPENEYALAKWLVCEEEKCTVMFIIADNDFNDLWNETIARICDMVQVLVTLHQDNHKPDEVIVTFHNEISK
ncbi:Patatin-like phospholipase domain-containing protein 7 [Orchesella cincta]|uniref:Patatin-like phospholipase domain-containing protein 7 n=1 Tax=Orchesella cincta TaxID=48709 RepID=A0A1D2MMN2_ORCCI|nr:Patatin-like phospholipase domain-containing protein 7 [Orchesella cincta]